MTVIYNIIWVWLLYTFPLNIILCANYTLYELTAFNQRERNLLYSIYAREEHVIFMNGISNEAAIQIDVAVENEHSHTFETVLQGFDIKYVYFPEPYLSLDMIQNQSAKHTDVSRKFLDWNGIQYWIDSQVKKNNIFQKIVIAKTYERRDIIVTKISNGHSKPIVFIVGGEDGKDWMSSAIVLNIANTLIKNFDKDTLLKEYDFYLLPLLNPDGFVYSTTHDRFWTKNRRVLFPPVTCFQNSSAIGVNIARNWFFQKTTKILHEECRGVYIGYKPLSEEETQALSFVLNSIAINMIAFITVKGFGKFITIPYATKQTSNNYEIIMDILNSACTTVQSKHNSTYYVDTTNKFLYNLTGNMADWVKKKLNVPVVFTTYLEYNNDLLPKTEDIIPLSQEFYTILNETLSIAKDIYEPLYMKHN